jgi:SAM-dependent methyltransferase
MTGDAENLPFPDKAFDIVSVHDGLHHLPNPHAAIQEMCRVARKAIVIIEPARSWLTRQAVQAGLALDFEDAGNFVYRLREGEIVDIARTAGFDRFRHKQYLLYYKHEPFRWAKYIEKTPLFYLFPLGFNIASLLAPRLGNKICVVCERSNLLDKKPTEHDASSIA